MGDRRIVIFASRGDQTVPELEKPEVFVGVPHVLVPPAAVPLITRDQHVWIRHRIDMRKGDGELTKLSEHLKEIAKVGLVKIADSRFIEQLHQMVGA